MYSISSLIIILSTQSLSRREYLQRDSELCHTDHLKIIFPDNSKVKEKSQMESMAYMHSISLVPQPR